MFAYGAPFIRRLICRAFVLALFCCAFVLASNARGADNLGENLYPVSVDGFHVIDFKTENLVAPQGVDVLKPRFSWKLFSQDLNESQSAYQLTVRKAFGDELVWDSGKVESDAQLYVQYDGKDLEPATEYMVELNVWNKDGSKKSQIYAPFSTGLFPTDAEPNPWKGKWIGIDSKEKEPEPADIAKANWISFSENVSAPVGASAYRKTFEVGDLAAVARAILNVTGDNSCSVFINGTKLGGSGDFKIAPARDLTPYLQAGKNVVAVRVDNVGSEANPGGLLGSFYVATKDGAKTEYFTDESWKAIEGFEDAYVALEFDDSAWANAHNVAKCGDGPWNKIETAPLEKISPARYLANVYWMKKDVDVKRAVVFISGLGYNECYLNGEKLGDQVCGPMYTDYDKSVPYNTYDVTDILQTTKKFGADDVEIGVALGNGRFYALRSSCVHYGDPRLLFQMQVEYEDGTKDLFVSDESWKGTADGPISENNDYDGEVVDGRKAKLISPDSDELFFKEGDPIRYLETRFGKGFVVATPDDVDIMDAPKGRLVSQMIPPMRETLEIKAQSLKEIAPGRWIIDFGQNFVGVPRIKVKGEAGTQFQIRFAESLIPDGEKAGELYVDNLRTAKARDIYTLYGDPDGEIYEPRFTQHGGRYAELTGFPGTPTLETVTGYTVTTDLPLIGRFETSNELINKIFKNIEWGTRGNYLSMPTDCPQRDERHGWQGDRAAESKGEMYIFDNSTLYNKWMQDVEESQIENGNVSDVAPAYWRLYSANVTWPTAQIIVPQSLLVMRGDDSAIVKHYDSRKKWLDYMLTLLNDDGTISKDNYGDWCVPPEKPELIHSADPARQTDRTLLATSYLIYDLRISAEFADYLGKTDDAKYFREQADKMHEAFTKRFYDPEAGRYANGSQTSCVLPLAFDLVPTEDRAKVFKTLTDNIENVTNKHIGTGLIGGQWINRLLSDEGRIDLCYDFATNDDFPSWGYMVKKGATTIWELWNGDTADPAMNSGNHVMLVGDLGIWFFEYLAGIKADETAPGFKRFIMRPNVVGDLTSARASYDSARGLIISDWNWDKEASQFVWRINVPANTTASISVPTTNPESLAIETVRFVIVPPENGEIRTVKYDAKVETFDVGALDVKAEDGRATFELGSGSYVIKAELK